MSKSASSAFAAWRTRPAMRLTPRLILPERTIAVCRAAALILLVVAGGEPGGADDVDDARLRRELGEGERRGRHGEVEHAVGRGEDRQRVGGDRDAALAHAGERARVRADLRRVGPLDGAGEADPLRSRR